VAIVMVAGMGIGKTIAHKLQRRLRAAIQAFAKQIIYQPWFTTRIASDI
jgi:hypothetical protein